MAPSTRSPNTNNIEYDSDGYAKAFSSSSEESFSPFIKLSGSGGDKYASVFGYGASSSPSNKSTAADGSEWATTASNGSSDANKMKLSFSKRSVHAVEQGKLTSALTETVKKTKFHPNKPSQKISSPPKGVSGLKEPPKSEIVKKREMAWICDNFGSQNTPFDFLCWACKAHHRCQECKALVPERWVEEWKK